MYKYNDRIVYGKHKSLQRAHSTKRLHHGTARPSRQLYIGMCQNISQPVCDVVRGRRSSVSDGRCRKSRILFYTSVFPRVVHQRCYAQVVYMVHLYSSIDSNIYMYCSTREHTYFAPTHPAVTLASRSFSHAEITAYVFRYEGGGGEQLYRRVYSFFAKYHPISLATVLAATFTSETKSCPVAPLPCAIGMVYRSSQAFYIYI